MTTKEKLNELGYQYNVRIDVYTKEIPVESEQVFGTYKILRTISLDGRKYPVFWVKPLHTISFNDMDTINEFYNVLRNEYYATKKDFESLKGLEPSSKERLDDFIYEINNCEDDDVSIEELASYKRLLKDLEVLSILKKQLNFDLIKERVIFNLPKEEREK